MSEMAHNPDRSEWYIVQPKDSHFNLDDAINEQQLLHSDIQPQITYQNEWSMGILNTEDYLARQSELLARLENTQDQTERTELADSLELLARANPELDQIAMAIRRKLAFAHLKNKQN